MLVALPETEAQVRAVLDDLPSARACRWWRAARAPACRAARCRMRCGVMLSLAKFNRIVEIDPLRAHRARAVAACAIWRSPRPPRPTACTTRPTRRSQIACTIGGNVAENSGGVHCLKYGLTLHNVLRVRGFTIDGERVEFGSEALDAPGLDLLAVVIGSEGMLAVVTEVTVKLMPKPQIGALHHGQFRRRGARPATRSPRSSPPASFRPAWR